jgi:hypothetical protein
MEVLSKYRLDNGVNDLKSAIAFIRERCAVQLKKLVRQTRVRFRTRIEDAQDQPADLDELGATLWKRVLNTIGRDAIKDQTSDWPAYFQGLRGLVTNTITNISNTGLSVDQQALLIRRLIERIDRFERLWPVSNRKDVGQQGAEPQQQRM